MSDKLTSKINGCVEMRGCRREEFTKCPLSDPWKCLPPTKAPRSWQVLLLILGAARRPGRQMEERTGEETRGGGRSTGVRRGS